MNDPARGVARLVRAPALHFFAIGGLLFVLNAGWQTWTQDDVVRDSSEPLVVTAAQVDQLRRELTAQNGFPPSAEQLRAAIEATIDEEVLYRQALAIGLDRGNAAVRQRLVQIARFVADEPDQDEEALYQMALQLGLDRSDLVVQRQLAMMMRLVAANVPFPQEAPPGEEELEAYLRRHPGPFMEPWRVRLTHVYLSENRRGALVAADAQHLLGELRTTRIAPDDAPQLGDHFLLGHHLPWQTRQGLQRSLGGAFAEAVAELEPGVWSEPIRSSYGWHLVWVHAVRPAAVPALTAVRDKVHRAVLEEHRERRLQETLSALRARYSIRVEHPLVGGAVPRGRNADG